MASISDNDVSRAREIQREYPAETWGLNVYEIAFAWREYSDLMEAGWMGPDAERVGLEMERMREKNRQRAVDSVSNF